jgi:MFS family permease
MPKPLLQGLSVLRHRDFRLFLFARIFATVAVQMQGVAVGWQIYALTGNALDLGLIGLSQFAPFVLLVLVAGHVADTVARRSILFLCYGVEALCGAALLAYTVLSPGTVWPVFLILGVYGSARAFMMPASQSILPNLVPPEHFPQAVALASSSFQLSVIVGPALGGMLYLIGPMAAYFSVAALLSLSMIMIGLTRIKTGKASAERVDRSILSGLKFVRSRPVILGAISLDLFAVLFGGATALLPAFASDILHVGPTGLGLLRSAPGAGAALIAVVLTFHPIARNVGRWMFGGVALFGFCTILFGLSTSFPLSLAALFALGAGDMVSVYIRQMLVQLETPDGIRGRVSAVNAVFIGASNELGEFESGLAAAWLGLVPSVAAGGIATLMIAAVCMKGFPALRNMDRFPRSVR